MGTEKIAELFQTYEQSLNGLRTTTFHEQRVEALKRFNAVGIPHQKHEEYRYLNLADLRGKSFALPELSAVTAPVEELSIPGLQANTIVFVDGYFQPEQSRLIDDNLNVTNLEQTPKELLNEYFGKYQNERTNPFASLNIAFAREGAFIHVAKGQVIEHPVQIIHVNTGQDYVQPHHVLVAEENAQVKVIESYFSLADNGVDNTFFTIVAKPYANVDHYKVQLLGEQAKQFGTTYIKQYAHSVCTTNVYNLAGGLLRNNIHIDIEEERAEANMYGLYLSDGEEVFDNHTLVNHKVANCESNQLYKGVMNGSSTAVFNGKIFVQRDAQKTNAFQSNRNIVLSDEASVNTKPQLEIWADDVKCSHGCTIGKLSKDELFYLQARGIKEQKAKAMLTYAFANEVLTTCNIPELREFVAEGIAAKLGFEM